MGSDRGVREHGERDGGPGGLVLGRKETSIAGQGCSAKMTFVEPLITDTAGGWLALSLELALTLEAEGRDNTEDC